MKELYGGDLARYPKRGNRYEKRVLKYFRKTQTSANPVLRTCNKLIYKVICDRHGIELPWQTEAGKGLYLGHAYNITVNPNAKIGKNCNLHKGIVLGQTNRGEKQGAPVLGDCVWVGINAAIVGGVTIGDDVLIAPNAFVNCDVPSHSVVFGNPCIIKTKENATDQYINRKAE